MVWSQRAAYMPVWGNHEWEDPERDDLRNYKGRFALPHAAASPGAPAPAAAARTGTGSTSAPSASSSTPSPTRPRPGRTGRRAPNRCSRRPRPIPGIKFVAHGRPPPGRSVGPPRRRPAAALHLLDGFGQRFPKYVLNLNGHSHAYERTQASRPTSSTSPRGRAAARWSTPNRPRLPVGRVQAAAVHGVPRDPPRLRRGSPCGRRSCAIEALSAARRRPGNEDLPLRRGLESSTRGDDPGGRRRRRFLRVRRFCPHPTSARFIYFDTRARALRRGVTLGTPHARRRPRSPYFTLPNLLSLARLPLVGLFWVALGPTPTLASAAAALAVLAAAAVTDMFDGMLARRSGTDLAGVGSPPDPICDKLFVWQHRPGGAAHRTRRPAAAAGAGRRARAAAAADVAGLPRDSDAATVTLTTSAPAGWARRPPSRSS